MKKNRYPIFEIVNAAAVSFPSLGEGRFLPILVIDTRGHIEVKELFKLASNGAKVTGTARWASLNSYFYPRRIELVFEFINPLDLKFAINLILDQDPHPHYEIVDGIMHLGGLFLKDGKETDDALGTPENKILIEVTDSNLDKKWEGVLRKILIKRYKRTRLPKKQMYPKINELIARMRMLWNVRRS